jgi:preprotein translocase subunit SecD
VRSAVVAVAAVLAIATGACSSDSKSSSRATVATTLPRSTRPDSATIRLAAERPLTAEQAARTRRVLLRRLDALGLSDADVRPRDGGLDVSVPRTDDSATVAGELTAPGVLAFRPVLATSGDDASLQGVALTTPEADRSSAEVVLASSSGPGAPVRYRLGPTALGSTPFESAQAGVDQAGQWLVNPVFRKGAAGIDGFNRLARTCFDGVDACPTRQLAIVVDHEVLSAPTIQQPTFDRHQIQISGGFDESSARRLAALFASGPLPVPLHVAS